MEYLNNVYILPHPPISINDVGKGEEKEMEETLLGIERIGKLISEEEPEVIVCITPHGNYFTDGICILDEEYLQGDLYRYGSSVSMQKKQEIPFIRELREKFYHEKVSCVFLTHMLAQGNGLSMEIDQGALVPLYHIDKFYDKYNLVHITPGDISLLELYKIGKMIKETAEKLEKKTSVVISGDLSHALLDKGPYTFHEDGKIFDDLIISSLRDKKFLNILNMDRDLYINAKQCGLRPICMGLGVCDGFDTKQEVFSYEGPFGVGYACVHINLAEKSNKSLITSLEIHEQDVKRKRQMREDDYIGLARFAASEYLRNKRVITPQDYLFKNEDERNGLFTSKAGCFVSLHNGENLRGCIGTIDPGKDNLASEIISNAILAATEDYRFYPIDKEEMDELDIKVDVLSKPIEVYDKDELNPKNYGIVVENELKRGVLLPDLEGVDDIDYQIQIAKNKAGIEKDERYKLYKFTVERHKV